MDFELINQKIQDFLQKHSSGAYQLNDEEYKLPLSDALFCALDTVRNRAFFTAISAAINDLRKKKKDIHLVYAGSGTGILGIFALLQGASSALFLEHNPHSLALSKELVKEFGLLKKVKFQECDARAIMLQKPYDLLISETITSGFVREEFPQIINHLRQFGSKDSIIVPEKFTLRLAEMNSQKTQIAAQDFSFVSQEGFAPKKIQLQSPKTTKVVWHTSVTLYQDTTVQSGDCISFVNEMTQKVENFSHPLFTLVRSAR